MWTVILKHRVYHSCYNNKKPAPSLAKKKKSNGNEEIRKTISHCWWKKEHKQNDINDQTLN